MKIINRLVVRLMVTMNSVTMVYARKGWDRIKKGEVKGT
jgi:hypothetical protein